MTRSYDQYCPVAHALDVVGERWTLLIVRDLMIGPKRYTDLQDGLPGISPNILAERLRDLVGAGVVSKKKMAPPAASVVFELTERGEQLEPALRALAEWGMPLLGDLPKDEIRNIDPLVLGLKMGFQPEVAGDLDEAYELHLDERVFTVRVSGGDLSVERGEGRDPALVLKTDPITWARIGMEGASLRDAVKRGHVTIEGDRPATTARRFAKVFALTA